MRKKMSIMCMMMGVIGLMAVSAFGAQYQAGSTTMTLNVGQCETRTVSLDCADFGTSPLVGGGFYIENSGTRVSINPNALVYDGIERTPGVWDPGAFEAPDPGDPPEIGDYFLAVGNLGSGVVPGVGVLIADMQFCCAGAGDSTITIRVLDPSVGYDLWVNQNQVSFDSQVSPFVMTVNCIGEAVCGNGALEGDEECDDGNNEDGDCCSSTCAVEVGSCDNGLYCDGPDECNASGVCVNVGPNVNCNDGKSCTTGDYCNEDTDSCVNTPVDSRCSDGLYCNGVETCDPEDVNANPTTGCVAGTPVNCPDDNLYCNGEEYCDEDANACASNGNPCPVETRVCIEDSDECRAPSCSITVEPAETTVNVLETVTFSVVVDGTCDNEPSYTWELSSNAWTGCVGGASGSAIGSTIDANGLYTAGNSGGTDYVRVTDVANGEICAYAEVTVVAPTSTTTSSVVPSTTTSSIGPTTSTTTSIGPTTSTTTSISPTTSTTTSVGPIASISVTPSSLFQSRWIPIPRRLRIEGTNTNFARRSSTVTFQPANAVLKLRPLVLDKDTILIWVYVMPRWLTGEIDSVNVTVKTGAESASDDVAIQLLPFPLDEEK